MYNAAIIGLGNVAWKYDRNVKNRQYNPLSHAGSYLANNQTKLLAGCSINDKDCQEFTDYYRVPAFKTVDDLLKNSKIDIISICSPTEFHAEHFMLCVDYGIQMIWLEKPSAMSVKELAEMTELASKSKTTVLVNYPRRFLGKYKMLHECYQSGQFGEPKEIVLHYSKGLFINGSHIIDTLFMILGQEFKFNKDDISLIHNSENPSFFMKTLAGVPIYVVGHNGLYHSREISVFFENGRISINQEGLQLFIEERAEQDYYPGFFRLKDKENKEILENDFDLSMTYALENVIDSYESKKETRSNLKTSLITQQVTDYILDRVNG